MSGHLDDELRRRLADIEDHLGLQLDDETPREVKRFLNEARLTQAIRLNRLRFFDEDARLRMRLTADERERPLAAARKSPPREPSNPLRFAARLIDPSQREEILDELHDQVETAREHGRSVRRETLSILRGALVLALWGRWRAIRGLVRRS